MDGRDAAAHPTMHRDACTTQNYWAYNVNGAGAEKIVSDCMQPNGLYLPGFFVHGIFRARILEFIAIFYLGDLRDSGFKPRYLASSALTGRFFTTSAT